MAEFDIVDMTSTLKRAGLSANRPEFLVIHSTRSYPEFEELLALHRKRGFAGVGYHFFVSASMKVYQARPIDLEGAHALGFNRKSVGLCVYSKDGSIEKEAIETSRRVISHIMERTGELEIIPHTSAQIIYLNQLLDKAGISERFDSGSDITDPKVFSAMQKKLSQFLTEHQALGVEEKRIITGFKNCPGPMFDQIV
ncbi:MAG: N-acetylmuramoyl-L-alanine amidase [Candidatus Micrarchaeota archaeon]|nr:N-acetylmuramoyl-L-alanine amidase [Candidatus Micrarchaeota archaeon]